VKEIGKIERNAPFSGACHGDLTASSPETTKAIFKERTAYGVENDIDPAAAAELSHPNRPRPDQPY
jgi:hypothetical protein